MIKDTLAIKVIKDRIQSLNRRIKGNQTTVRQFEKIIKQNKEELKELEKFIEDHQQR